MSVVDDNKQAEQEREIHLAQALHHAASKLLGSTLNLNAVLDDILGYLADVIPYDTASVMLIEEGIAFIVRHRGYAERGLVDVVDGLRFPIEETPNLKTMVETQKPFFIPDTTQYEEWQDVPQQRWIQSYIGAPVHLDAEVIGFLNVDSSQKETFDEQHALRLEMFADLVANALHNARLYAMVQQANESLEQRVAERTAELMEAKERAEAIFTSSSDAIVIADTNGCIRQVNPAFELLFGYEPEELLGKLLTRLVVQSPALTHLLQAVYKQQIKEGRQEMTARRKDSTSFAADVSLSPVVVGGETVGVISHFHDITMLKQTEDSLRRALAHEQEMNELKSRFISMASHEFRTPLASILLSSQMLSRYKDRLSEDKKMQKVENIRQRVEYMKTLIEDVLMVGRMDGNRVEYAPKPTAIVHFCQAIVDDMVHGASQQIIVTVEGPCDTHVSLDPHLIRQALTNLLSNAIKYSPHTGRIDVSLRCEPERVVIMVRDEGIGIPAKDQPHLFDPFHRGENVGTISGTGLGLAIAKRAIDLHDGRLDFYSVENEGATFTIMLPKE